MEQVVMWKSNDGSVHSTKEEAEHANLLKDIEIVYNEGTSPLDRVFNYKTLYYFNLVIKTLLTRGVEIKIKIPKEVLDKYVKV